MSFPFVRRAALAALILVLPSIAVAQDTPRPAAVAPQGRVAPGAMPAAERPFGTLREQAAMQQAWLKQRLDTFLPPLMRKHGIDLWVVPMREYNEDPVFSSITAPETFAARRRTIYVFFDKCAAASAPVTPGCVERIALGGTSQGGVFDARTSAKPVVAAVGGRQAELWGDEQWQALKQIWFQPSVDVQRKGVKTEQLGEDPVIQPGDVLHCDVGITVARLNTDTQHDAYVLLPGETDAPSGLKKALTNANAMQDIAMEETRPGRTGNEILSAVRQRMKARGIDGTMYSHPIGMNGHGAGPLIGLWDYQDGVPDRGEAKVIPSMWFSIELQATTPVPEWGGQPVRIAQEEDMIVGADGNTRWALKRQDRLFLVGSKR